MMFTFEQLHCGMRVVREDGLKGRIAAVELAAPVPYLYVEYEDGTAESLTEADFPHIYRIHSYVFGNRVSGAEIAAKIDGIAEQIKATWEQIADFKKQYAHYKPLYWRMKEELNAHSEGVMLCDDGKYRFADAEKQKEFGAYRDAYFGLKNSINTLYDKKYELKEEGRNLRKCLYRLNYCMNGGEYIPDDEETEQNGNKDGESND